LILSLKTSQDVLAECLATKATTDERAEDADPVERSELLLGFCDQVSCRRSGPPDEEFEDHGEVGA